MTKIIVWNNFEIPLRTYLEFFNQATQLKNTMGCDLHICVSERFLDHSEVIDKAFGRYKQYFTTDGVEDLYSDEDVLFIPEKYSQLHSDKKVVVFDSKDLIHIEDMAMTAIVTGQFDKFAEYLPNDINMCDKTNIYRSVRAPLDLDSIGLPPPTETREKFYSGNFVSEGQLVTHIPTGNIAMVEKIGPNFVEIKIENSFQTCWPKDITPIEE